MDTTFAEKDTHLAVTCKGEWTHESVIALVESIVEMAASSGNTRILVDWLEVSAPHSEFDRFQGGALVAELIGPLRKLAVIYRNELINKFAENAAVNRGANMLVCSTRDEALKWLLADDT